MTTQPPSAANAPIGGVTEHWDELYRTRDSGQFSWTQAEPVMSLRLIDRLSVGSEDAIVDVGGGDSTLVDALLARGQHEVTVLDAAPHALECARARLIRAGQAGAAATVTWQTGDVLTWRPPRSYRAWHDRAVFHFLTNPADRATYVNLAASAVTPGGFLIVATFALGGPTHCSGLPVARYGPDELAAQFAPHFASLIADDEQHHTPWGVKQHFTWQVLRRCI
jgi:trans-aconitate methyltransferase